MKPASTPLAVLVWLSLAVATPCRSDSLVSSASSAGSASVGSLSDSVRGSSHSSSPATPQVAEGAYRIVAIAEVALRPEARRLSLQAIAAGAALREFTLDLPARTLAQWRLSAQDIVDVRRRDYGLAFARADTREPFFLVLDDGWRGELDARAVTL
jgi:hypothetical protein